MSTIFLSLVGGFYVFAGIVAMRATLTGRLLDHAISQIGVKPPPAVDVMRARWLIVISVLTFLSGLLLIARLDAALWAFLACTLVQALYLFDYAPRVLDKLEAPDPRGRQQTKNAFVIYLAATAGVAWAWTTNLLTPLTEAPWLVLALVGMIAAAYAAYAIRAGRIG